VAATAGQFAECCIRVNRDARDGWPV